VGDGNFSVRHPVQTGFGAHPASYTIDTGASFSGIKQPRREVDHSFPSSAKIKE